MLINVNTNVICINNSKESNWKIDLFFNRDISRCSQVNVFTQNISKVYVALFICHIHNHTEYNQQWNVFSAFNPSIKSAHTHLEQWAADTAAPGEQLGVRCLAQESHLSRGQFLPEPRFEPTTSDYKSDALSIRPRLPRITCGHCFRTFTIHCKLHSGLAKFW